MTQVDTDGNHGLFLHEQLAHLHTGSTQKNVSNIASDEDIMENNYMFVMLWNLKVALQILGQKFHKNTEKSSLYSQSLLIFIYKTPVVESHPTIREISDLLRPR